MASARSASPVSVMRLPDGRELGYAEYGDTDGVPVFGFHGTPGSRLQLAPTVGSPLPKGFRLIAPDRPGYGHSTFYAARRLVDWPNDVVALADHLRLDRFAVLGISGGGPHVLACAHALGPRLLGVGCVSGVGPLHDPAAAEGMLGLNRMLALLARRARWLLRALMRVQFGYLRRNPERAMDMMVRQLPAPDRKLFADPAFRHNLTEDMRQNSTTMPLAAAQDFELFASDWGFSLADIAVPVHFFQGGVDRNVPAKHAELMAARTPGSVLHRYPDEGHFMVIERLPEIVRTITTAT